MQINTAGAEDSPFITPDGRELYFTFVPDVRVPPQKQLIDGVTGLYIATLQKGEWRQAERVVLNNDLSLDGCELVQGNVLWFCSVRAGNFREVDMYTAELVDGKWSNWQNAGERLNAEIEIGEMHITMDGDEIYFDADRPGGKGGHDIWVTRKVNGEWQMPENVETVNTEENEIRPFITQDGSELWFSRRYLGSPAVFRSRNMGGEWGEPELIISQFAAEPSLDEQGNIYFAHHFFENGIMLEADIYVAYKRK
jgi:Tol biopolymer transport system component